jgi:uncharacterized protein
MVSRRLLAAGFAAASLAACATGAGAQQLEPLEITTAKGIQRFQVEIADTEAERAQGLMYRQGLETDRGMLFIFEAAEPQSFWMKNTLIPLDIIFIGADGRVLNIEADAKPLTLVSRRSAGPAKFVLELKAGEAARRGIAPGAKVRHRAIPR